MKVILSLETLWRCYRLFQTREWVKECCVNSVTRPPCSPRSIVHAVTLVIGWNLMLCECSPCCIYCITEWSLCTFRGKKALSKKKLKRRQKVKSKVKSRTKVRCMIVQLIVPQYYTCYSVYCVDCFIPVGMFSTHVLKCCKAKATL